MLYCLESEKGSGLYFCCKTKDLPPLSYSAWTPDSVGGDSWRLDGRSSADVEFNLTAKAVPEPAIIMLIGLGLGGLLLTRHRNHRS